MSGARWWSYRSCWCTTPLRSPWLPVLLAVVVASVDVLRVSVTMGLTTNAVTDEVAHISTALLALLAAVRPDRLVRHRTSLIAALLASVAIDVDHLPVYAGVPGLADGGRPVSHSFITAGLLLAAGLISPRARTACAGAAVGVALHLVRDVATGPGAPLMWPWTAHHVQVPHEAYSSLIGLLAVVAVGRRVGARWTVS